MRIYATIETALLLYRYQILADTSVCLYGIKTFMHFRRWLMWFMVCLILSINQICIGVAVSCTIVFINNSVTFDKLGTINGLATTLTSIGRYV